MGTGLVSLVLYHKRRSKWCLPSVAQKRKIAFDGLETSGVDSIPIFIISYNRLSYLKQLVSRLEEMGKKNIKIIDNHSTYPPLLEYYMTIPYRVFYMDDNYGHMVFWKKDDFKKYRNNFYMITDSDVIPSKECPNDFVERFISILKEYPNIRKVGFSLRIENLPDNKNSDDIKKIECEYWKHRIRRIEAYIASIDTTFALYAPDDISPQNDFFSGIRTDKPYDALHLPWYRDSEIVSEEEMFYSNTKMEEVNHWDA